MSVPDLAVVGGGVAGSAVALAARDLGADVVLLDRGRVGGRATGASAGMLAAQYEASGPGPLFRLGLLGREQHPSFLRRVEELSGRSVPYGFEGMLVADRDEEEHARARDEVAWQGETGLRAEVLERADAAAIQPGLAPSIRSWLWLPDEGHVDTQALDAALAPALHAAGVRLVEDARVAAIRSGAGRVTGLETDAGDRLTASRVVVAAGAWSGQLEGLPRHLPIRPWRGQMLRCPAGGTPPLRPVADRRGRYLVPRGDGTVIAGSTMEDAGFEPTTTAEGLAAIRQATAALMLDAAAEPALERWAGLRPVTEDALPVLGPDPLLDGLSYAAGYGRNGILLAPAAGRAVAELALEQGDRGAWEAFSPARFEPAGAGTSDRG